jgi:hypothetical protein
MTCLLTAGISETDKMSVARQWFCKHISTATKSRDSINGYTRNSRERDSKPRITVLVTAEI